MRLNHEMPTTDFEILWDLLERTGDEVAGHSGQPPPEGFVEKLKRVAAGTATEAERKQICELLRDQPHLVRVFADFIKDALPGSDSRSDS